jgi:single-strand DNA-binding protein
MNSVILIGEVYGTVESKLVKERSLTVTKFRIKIPKNQAVQKISDYKNSDKNLLVDIVVFGKQAEVCKSYLHDGRCVSVSGRLDFENFVNSSHKHVNNMYVVAESVDFLGKADAVPEQLSLFG